MNAHHFVSECYLKAFVDPRATRGNKRQLWRLRFADGKVEAKTPKGIAKQAGYYSLQLSDGRRDDRLEEYWAAVESVCGPVLKRIRGGDLDVSALDISALLHLASMHFARVPSRRERLDAWLSGAFKKIRALDACHSVPPDSLQPDLQRESQLLFHSMAFLKEKAYEAMLEMGWRLVEAPTSMFLTSDNPVSVFNPRMAGDLLGHGLRAKTIEVLFPLSPRVCLMGTWGTGIRAACAWNDAAVAEANRRCIGGALHEMYGASRAQLADARDSRTRLARNS
jgi:hypothetical protein